MAAILIFAFSSCNKSGEVNELNDNTGGYNVTLKDSYDREVTLDKEPERVVSVAPSITEIIFALGQQGKLVGRTDYCDYPEEVQNIESIGNIDQPNVEKIVELQPDIVITSTIFTKEMLQKLEEAGVKVAIFQAEKDFEGVYDIIENIGLLLNARDEANSVVAEMKEKVELVKSKVDGLEKPSVYYVMGYGEYGDYTAGRDTFIARMIEMAGGKNAADDVEGWKYNIESLLEKDPDILICSKFYASKAGIESADGYKELSAVRGGKLFEIDNNMLDRQGPRVADGLLELARIIHPEAFE
ncbi:ABC transporter substrate-binding protein [Acetivibrio straminisolvens]|uniref:Vitamin B12 ABC transporter n=2 Tax=Acetivibrio straminisolvens TaxID=253314 RepID=W4V849_9FIRM|nr:ABC transporter substrate-binding protein [Acetivibrio straminisolvens]GAE89361.1 vitamin B12 ABC transporter [Acetivibrio straminisolvens JCM 21531]